MPRHPQSVRATWGLFTDECKGLRSSYRCLARPVRALGALVWLSACLRVCLSACLDDWLSVRVCACLAVCLRGGMRVCVCLPVCVSACVSGCLCVSARVRMSVCVCLCVCVVLYVCVSVWFLSGCVPVSLHVCLRVCPSVRARVSVYLSASVSTFGNPVYRSGAPELQTRTASVCGWLVGLAGWPVAILAQGWSGLW